MDVRTGPPTRSMWLRVVVSRVEPTIETFGGDDLLISSARSLLLPCIRHRGYDRLAWGLSYMQLSIRQATPQDIDAVAEILGEAARWLEEQGMPMWHQDELQPNRIVADVDSGQFFLAECDGVPAGAIRFQLEDRLFWPDVPQDDSAFIHRLAVRRRFAGGEVSSALLLWAIARTNALGRRYLRLDCEASRARLRAVYERIGFRFHSNKQVGPYFVARYEYDVTEISHGTRKPK
jgi:GNAT superfamily N-acetyltransferase